MAVGGEPVTIDCAVAPFRGSIRMPGDKSISHRAIMLAAMASGTSHICGLCDCADVRATLSAVRSLGASVDLVSGQSGSFDAVIAGWGDNGLRPTRSSLHCGNSGTTARLMMGVLASSSIPIALTGDASLCRRPMGRIVSPLSEMGVSFRCGANDTWQNGEAVSGCSGASSFRVKPPVDSQWHLPLVERGSGSLRACKHDIAVSSAQVKSALLIAGLYANGFTSVSEPYLSRDHTERMLPCFGVDVVRDGLCSGVVGPASLRAVDLEVPGDPSSAAFIVAAAVLFPGSSVTIEHVCLNPTRIAYLDVLREMGARIEWSVTDSDGFEPIGDISAEYSENLHGCVVPPDRIASLIDEIPVLSLIASQSDSSSAFQGIDELRVKETDRAKAIVEGLRCIGADACLRGSDLIVEGLHGLPPARSDGVRCPLPSALDSHGDHRLAMTWALAGLCGFTDAPIEDFDCVDVSYPDFMSDMRRLSSRSS